MMVRKAKTCSVIKQACMFVCYDCTIITNHNVSVKFQLSALVLLEIISIFRKQLKHTQTDE